MVSHKSRSNSNSEETNGALSEEPPAAKRDKDSSESPAPSASRRKRVYKALKDNPESTDAATIGQFLRKLETGCNSANSPESATESAISESHFDNVSSALKFLLGELELEFEKQNSAPVRSHAQLFLLERFRNQVRDFAQGWNTYPRLHETLVLLSNGGSNASLISSVSLRKPVGIEASIDTVIEAIELAIDVLSSAGAKCFETRQIDRVELYRDLSSHALVLRADFVQAKAIWQRLSEGNVIYTEIAVCTPVSLDIV